MPDHDGFGSEDVAKGDVAFLEEEGPCGPGQGLRGDSLA